jgi:hypothetical protein
MHCPESGLWMDMQQCKGYTPCIDGKKSEYPHDQTYPLSFSTKVWMETLTLIFSDYGLQHLLPGHRKPKTIGVGFWVGLKKTDT